MRRTLEIVHEGVLGRLPADWGEWRHYLGRHAWSLYEIVHREDFDGAVVDVKEFARSLGMSQTALDMALERLEDEGLVTRLEE